VSVQLFTLLEHGRLFVTVCMSVCLCRSVNQSINQSRFL